MPNSEIKTIALKLNYFIAPYFSLREIDFILSYNQATLNMFLHDFNLF